MDVTTVVPIIVAALSALAGFLAWLAQKRIERQQAGRLRREKLYEQLLESIVELSSFGNGAPFLIESQRAWLYASDDVLTAANGYLRVFLESRPGQATTPEERATRQQAEGKIRLAIRRDLFRSPGITEQWVTDHWAPIAAPEEAIREYLERRVGKAS